MVVFRFTIHGKKALEDLPRDVQERVIEKLKVFKNHPDIFSLLGVLHEMEPATHRLRIGNYRIILSAISSGAGEIIFDVLDVGHRKNIYM